MKTLEDLKIFYDTQLLPDLRILEKDRKKILPIFIIAISISLAAVIICPPLFFIKYSDARNRSLDLLFIIMTLTPIICTAICIFVWQIYTSKFKSHIIGKIIHFINANLIYHPAKNVSETTFKYSNLCIEKPDVSNSYDLILGQIDQTEIMLILNMEKPFKGLFFVADFNKDFTCQIIILPDIAQNLLGHTGQILQAMNPYYDQLIKLDDPEFEKYFVIYSDDQIQARYILSTSMMKRIIDFTNRTRKDIRISFINSKVHIAIPCEKNIIDPKIFGTLLNFESITEYFLDLQLLIGIVDDLNLNNRIWSKE